MDNKDFALAMYVPGLWLVWLVFNIVLTIASPVLFVVALFNEHTPLSLVVELLGGLTEDPE